MRQAHTNLIGFQLLFSQSVTVKMFRVIRVQHSQYHLFAPYAVNEWIKQL